MGDFYFFHLFKTIFRASLRSRSSCSALIFLFVTLSISCGGPRQPVTGVNAAGEIVIGEYGSLTGSEATFGQSEHNGVEMAVADVNARGGIRGHRIHFVNYDDQGKTSEVGTAVTRLITEDKVLVVIGEVSSSLSIAGGQIAQQHEVPMISPSSTNPKVTETGDYVFRVCFIDPFQGDVMARFAYGEPTGPDHGLGFRRVALLIDNRQAYSQGLAANFVDSFTRLGGSIVADEKYQGGDQDFSAQLTRIRQTAPQAIFIPGYYTDIANIARQAHALGINAVLLGGDGWESVTDIAGDALEGAYYSNHYAPDEPRPEVRQFVDRYAKLYGKTPDSMAALGYDAIMLVAEALTRDPAAPINRTALREKLAQTRDFHGVTGTISIDAQRNAEKPAVVLQIHGKDVVTATAIQPTPAGTVRPRPAVAAPVAPLVQSANVSNHSFLQFFFKGLSVGSLYALLALGYTMVYGILQFINFAHSDVFMLGAFLAWRLCASLHLTVLTPLSAIALLLFAMAACALVGFLIERLAYRPLRQAPRINVLITAIGVSLFIENVGQLVFGKSVVQFPPLPERTFVLGGVDIRVVELVAVGAALLLMALLQLLVFGTRVGRAMRAVSHDHQVAGLMGIPVDRIISLTFIIGSALAGAAGLLVAVTYGQIKQPADSSWILYGLKAFVAAVIGGIGNLPGAMLGGLLLGLAEQFVAGYVSTTFRDAIAFALLIVILLVRPTGLLGKKMVEKV